MKYFSVILLFVFIVVTVGQTWIGIGSRQPGETLLGFAQNSTSSPTLQNQTVRLFYHGVPGNNISFVHVNIDPRYSTVIFPVLNQFYDFWVDIYLNNATYLSANMYVYGFRPLNFSEKINFEQPIGEPNMVTLHGNDN